MAVNDTDVPTQVRVRTDPSDGYAHRYDAIRQAAERFACNNTQAIVNACETVGPLLDNLERALADERLPPELTKDLADAISTRYIKVEYDGPKIDVGAK